MPDIIIQNTRHTWTLWNHLLLLNKEILHRIVCTVLRNLYNIPTDVIQSDITNTTTQ